MTYTVTIPDARALSTLLDALNTHEITVSRVREVDSLREWRIEEVERITELRSLLLRATADSPALSEMLTDAANNPQDSTAEENPS